MKSHILPLILLLLIAGLSAAGPVFKDVYKFGLLEGVIQDPQGPFGNTAAWTHQMPYGGDPGNIVAASLKIEATGIENILSLDLDELDLDGPRESLDWVTVSFNNQVLGTMDGDVKTFDLDPSLLNGPLDVEAVIQFHFDPALTDLLLPVDIVRLNRSTLFVTAVPAPGAILLCGIGTLMVGYLKNRKRL